MIFRQYLHINPAIAASYLLGCGGKSSGAVIDPLGEVDMYLEDAERLGLKILYVIDTHLHADHISSARELVRRMYCTKAQPAITTSITQLTAICSSWATSP